MDPRLPIMQFDHQGYFLKLDKTITLLMVYLVCVKPKCKKYKKKKKELHWLLVKKVN